VRGLIFNKMITEIELAVSNHSRCKICKGKIRYGNPRGIDFPGFICHKCFIEKNEKDIDFLKNLNKEFKKVLKSKIRDLILQELENEKA